MDVGFGFYTELTLAEALAFIEKKTTHLEKYVTSSHSEGPAWWPCRLRLRAEGLGLCAQCEDVLTSKTASVLCAGKRSS